MQKVMTVDGINHPVTIQRRKGARSIRLSLSSGGKITLSVPYGVPMPIAMRFLTQKSDWINTRFTPKPQLQNGSHIGKAHRIVSKITDAQKPSTKIASPIIAIHVPSSFSELETQELYTKASIKALMTEAKQLLPQRLETLSKQHQLPYRSCTIKRMTSRWGACDQDKNITLNCYLMQLDWQVIDYVLCHELAHTVHAHHQKSFWELVETMQPKHKAIRKLLKSQPTHVKPT